MGRAQCSESHLDASSLMDSGGGKNSISTWKKPEQIRELHVATYNARTLRTKDHLEELEREVESIKWDIVGLGETR